MNYKIIETTDGEILYSSSSYEDILKKIDELNNFSDYCLEELMVEIECPITNTKKSFEPIDFKFYIKAMYGTQERLSMKLSDLEQLLYYINRRHKWPSTNKKVKYVRPSFDMRTADIFHINMNSKMNEIDFSITNENSNKNLLRMIICYLEDEDEHYIKDVSIIEDI